MRRRIRWWLPVLLLAACQSAPPSVPPTIESFEADPPTVHAGQPSRLSWSVTGATTLAIAPTVGSVTGTTQVYVDPSVTTSYTLTATNAAGSAQRSTTVTVDASMTISGIVLAADGQPLPSTRLAVHGLPETTSGPDGRFTVPDVSPPYDVTLFHASDPFSVTYLGLTLDDPVLVMVGPQPGVPHDVAVSGTVSGGTNFPQPAGHLTRVAFGSEAVRAETDADTNTGAFQFDHLSWLGATMLPGALHALQWRHDAGGLPVDYVGHGYRPLTLDTAVVAYLAQDMALLGP
ncbi:MAG: carboxypeptidase-like regulatory domain-containing protein, partial [Trueperaceae bacterium]|nr:carboxypeptidase-like regulatory domain-containing protein [Trueperaceae bacterium]